MQPEVYVSWVLFGLVTAGLLAWVCHRLDRDREILGISLILLGGWYLVFGVTAGQGVQVLLPQAAGGLFFAACGLAGLKYSLLFLSMGWSLHAAWDIASPLFSDVSYMPHWTAPACLGFDLLLGTYIFAKWRHARSHSAAV